MFVESLFDGIHCAVGSLDHGGIVPKIQHTLTFSGQLFESNIVLFLDSCQQPSPDFGIRFRRQTTDENQHFKLLLREVSQLKFDARLVDSTRVRHTQENSPLK